MFMDNPQLHLTTTHNGGPRLDGFPLLCHAPDQWGPGIRTENNGTLVADIVAAHVGDLEETAQKFGITADHVRSAIAYSIMHSEPS
jgi:hypothetical protein